MTINHLLCRQKDELFLKDIHMSTTDPHHEDHADGIVEDREKAPPVYFTVLFYGLIIWGIAFMSFYLLSGWSSDAEFEQKMAAHKGEPEAEQQAVTPTPAAPVPSLVATSEVNAQELFAKHCAGCHGAEGKGAFGPDLSGNYQYGKTAIAAQESISSGRPGNMPAFDKKLSEEEIKALAEFILNL
jgi:cytochrome c oxidase cbb3-type subunit 3